MRNFNNARSEANQGSVGWIKTKKKKKKKLAIVFWLHNSNSTICSFVLTYNVLNRKLAIKRKTHKALVCMRPLFTLAQYYIRAR